MDLLANVFMSYIWVSPFLSPTARYDPSRLNLRRRTADFILRVCAISTWRDWVTSWLCATDQSASSGVALGKFVISSTAVEFCVAGGTKGGSKGARSMEEEVLDAL